MVNTKAQNLSKPKPKERLATLTPRNNLVIPSALFSAPAKVDLNAYRREDGYISLPHGLYSNIIAQQKVELRNYNNAVRKLN